jgi:hypothetical protein
MQHTPAYKTFLISASNLRPYSTTCMLSVLFFPSTLIREKLLHLFGDLFEW